MRPNVLPGILPFTVLNALALVKKWRVVIQWSVECEKKNRNVPKTATV
jgi:hypothetical protein